MAATGVSSKSFINARYSNLTDTHLSSTRFKKTLLGFKCNIDPKCGNLLIQESGRRNRVAAAAPARKKVEVVKCTAEGLERGIFGGKKGKFVMPERLKVVGLMACVMCLCNADRVVMSVAIVPLAAKHGWSSSFLGIVQVIRAQGMGV